MCGCYGTRRGGSSPPAAAPPRRPAMAARGRPTRAAGPVFLCLALALATLHCAVADLAVIQTTYGAVRGRAALSARGRIFVAFEGVPFAQPPLRALRFRAPRPPRPWSGVRDAGAPPPPCPQLSPPAPNGSRRVVGDEDCLYLSVYTRRSGAGAASHTGGAAPARVPVLVWVHGGGGFATGSAARDRLGPEMLMDTEVVLVVPQFRLGALGFLSSADNLVPGNFGLKDLVLALRWVRGNAAAFGGDARRVTVAGAGAGAALAHLLSLAPAVAAGGLARRAAALGGSGLAAWAFQRDPRPAARSLALAVGCPARAPAHAAAASASTAAPPPLSDASLACLRGVSASAIVVAASKLPHWSEGGAAAFAPVAEAAAGGGAGGAAGGAGEERLLLAPPAVLLRARAFLSELPLLVVAAAGAAAHLPRELLRDAGLAPRLRRDLRDMLQRQLARGTRPGLTAPAATLQLALAHYGSRAAAAAAAPAAEDALPALAEALADAWLGHPATLAARLTATATAAPVFFLLVEAAPPSALAPPAPPAPPAPRSAADVADLLEDLQPRPGLPSRSPRGEQPARAWADDGRRHAARVLAQVLAAFAASGDPTPRRWAGRMREWRPLGRAGRFRLVRAPPPPAAPRAEDASPQLLARVEFWDEQCGATRLLYPAAPRRTAPAPQQTPKEREPVAIPMTPTPRKLSPGTRAPELNASRASLEPQKSDLNKTLVTTKYKAELQSAVSAQPARAKLESEPRAIVGAQKQKEALPFLKNELFENSEESAKQESGSGAPKIKFPHASSADAAPGKVTLRLPTRTFIHRDIAKGTGRCICLIGSQDAPIEDTNPSFGGTEGAGWPPLLLPRARAVNGPWLAPSLAAARGLKGAGVAEPREWHGTCLRASRKG